MKTRKNIALTAMLVGVAWVACATDFTGWSGAGNPDLASSATWNLESGLPTDEINIKASGYTFEASADATFKAIYFSKANITNTFRLAQGRKITLNNGTSYALCGGANGGYNNMQTTFSGGTWDVGGGGFGPIYHYSYAPVGNTFILDDGCIVTNVGTLRVGYGNNADNCNNRLTIKGGSQLHVNKAYIVYGYAWSNTFEVVDGLFTWSDSSSPVLVGSSAKSIPSHHNLVRVSGANARVVSFGSKSPYLGGDNAYDNEVVVENGGVWSNNACGFYIGNGVGAHTQRLIARSGGKILRAGAIYVNYNSGSYSNSVEVLDGGEINAGVIYLSSTENSSTNIGGMVLVSNATLKCSRIYSQKGISPGQIVRIMGPDAVFEPSYASTYPLFGCGGSSLFSLEDGATWIYGHDLATGYTSSFSPSNRVQVIDRAKLECAQMTVGYGNSYTEGHVIYVANNAEFRTRNDIRLYAHDNTVIVSNALLAVGANFSLGLQAAATGGFTNNTLNVQGDVPRVRVAGDMTAKEATRILFDVPDGGYATTNVPIMCAKWNDYGKTKIEFTGLERLVESLKSKVVMPLVQVTNETFSAKFKTSVEAAKKLLPPKCSLTFSEDNDLLRLTVRPGIGYKILVR